MVDGRIHDTDGEIYQPEPRPDAPAAVEVPGASLVETSSVSDIGRVAAGVAASTEVAPSDTPTVEGELMDGQEDQGRRRGFDTAYHKQLLARPSTTILGGNAVEVDAVASDIVGAQATKMRTEKRTGVIVAVRFNPQPKSGMVTWAHPEDYKVSNNQVNSDEGGVSSLLDKDTLVETLASGAVGTREDQYGDVARTTFDAVVKALTDPETGRKPTLREIRDGMRVLHGAKPDEEYGELPALGYTYDSYQKRTRLIDSIDPEKRKDNMAVYGKLADYMNRLAPDVVDKPIEPSRFQGQVPATDIDPTGDITLLHAGMANGFGSGLKARVSLLTRALLPIADGQTAVGRPAAIVLTDFDKAFEADPEAATQLLAMCNSHLIPVTVHVSELNERTMPLVQRVGTRVLLQMDAIEAGHTSRLLGGAPGTLPSGRSASFNANVGTNDNWSENTGYRALLPGVADNTGRADSGGLAGGLAFGDSENTAFSMETPNVFGSEITQNIRNGEVVVVADPASSGGIKYQLRTHQFLGEFPPARPQPSLVVDQELKAIAAHVQNAMQRHLGELGTGGSAPDLPSAEQAAIGSGLPPEPAQARRIQNPLEGISPKMLEHLRERQYQDDTNRTLPYGKGKHWNTWIRARTLYEEECRTGKTGLLWHPWLDAKEAERQKQARGQ